MRMAPLVDSDDGEQAKSLDNGSAISAVNLNPSETQSENGIRNNAQAASIYSESRKSEETQNSKFLYDRQVSSRSETQQVVQENEQPQPSQVHDQLQSPYTEQNGDQSQRSHNHDQSKESQVHQNAQSQSAQAYQNVHSQPSQADQNIQSQPSQEDKDVSSQQPQALQKDDVSQSLIKVESQKIKHTHEESKLPQDKTADDDNLHCSLMRQKEKSAFDIRDHCALRLRKINDTVLCKVMLDILIFGTKGEKPPDMTFENFLSQVRCMTKTQYKGKFSKSQREKLETDPTGVTFDVTLLYSCIKYACKDIDPPDSQKWITPGDNLERTVTTLKCFRNELMHEESRISMEVFMEKAEEIRNNLEKALRLAGEKYSIDSTLIEEHVDDMNNSINDIRHQPVAIFDITNYAHMVLYGDLQRILLTSGKREIAETYSKFCNFNPVSFIAGKEFHLNVEMIFTRIEVVLDQRCDPKEDCQIIEYEDMLSFVSNSHPELKQVKLLEGPAGSGKSTLTRKMMRDWVEGDSTMEDLMSFDLVIYMECRDSTNTSLHNLLTSLMPKTARKFCDGDLEKCALGLKLLFIIDGLDELNKASTHLFKEIMDLKKKYDISIFCTTRPEKIEDCYKMMPSGEESVHLKIIGITDSHREEFASRYHEELRRLDKSQQETRGLIAYLRRNGSQLQDHWRLPLNLLLLTVLWADAPEKVNCVTTATELYFEIHKLTVEKLLVRLMCNEQTRNMGVRGLQRRVENFVVKLCWEALRGLKNDEIILSEASIATLIQTCNETNLPEEESFGAFLVQKIMWRMTGMLHSVSYPHKGIQDFLSAVCILLQLKEKGLDIDIRGIVKYDLGSPFSELGSDPALHGPARMQSMGNQFTSTITRATNTIQKVFQRVSRRCSRMISAFRRRERPIRTYRTPILERARRWVSEPVLDIWRASSQDTISITKVLKELHHGNENDIKYYKFNNTFVHLTGLLHLTNKNKINRRFVEELVKILKQTGIKKKEQWLDLISNVKCDDIVADVIAEKIPCITMGETTIKDVRVYSYVSLFQKKCPKSVNVDITAKPRDIPRLEELLLLLSDHACEVTNLAFHDEFQYPDHVTSGLDWAVQRLFQDCLVKNYRGVMSSRMCSTIPQGLEKLRVGIGSPEEYSKLQAILTSTDSALTVKRLALHLSHGIDPAKLSPLHRGLNVHLYLSNVDADSVDWACRIALALRPTGPNQQRGFVTILFPRCKLGVSDFEKLIEEFEDKGVQISIAICTSASIPFDKAEELQTLAQQRLRVNFTLMPEYDLWRKW